MKKPLWLLTALCGMMLIASSAAFAQLSVAYRETATLGRGPILAAAWSPDGQRFAVSSGDPGLWLYDQAFHDVAHLAAPSGAWLAWNSDGTQLATANIGGEGFSPDHVAYVWDIASRQVRLTLDLPGDAIYAVTWTPDGTRLLTRGQQSLQLWDAGSGRLLRRFTGITGGHDLSFSPDGKHVLTSGDGPIAVWNVDGFTKEFEFAMPSTRTSATWSPDGQKIAIASAYAPMNDPDASLNALQIRDAHSGNLLMTIQTDYADSVAWSGDGR